MEGHVQRFESANWSECLRLDLITKCETLIQAYIYTLF